MRAKGFVPILVVALFAVFLLILASLGVFYLKGQFENKAKSQSTIIPENKPEDIVTAFFQAVKNKDRTQAKSFLSGNANKEAFQSTFEDNSNSPSLYNQEFTFKIIDSKTDPSGNKSFVNVDIVVASQTLPTKMTLEKNASDKWLITDSQTAAYGKSNLPFEQQPRQSQEANRVLLLLNGPAEFYVTSPEGTHTGYDPNSKSQVNEIEDASYRSVGEPKSLTITDLIGTWELKVIGTGSGKYSITTQLVTPQEPQTAVVEGNTTSGSVETYIVKYPSEAGKALELTPIK